jgi:delta 1-pyrroline-5-carboxylate dehydrogenase
MLRYDGMNSVTPMPGEKNQAFYIPLGVGVVIAPWNFPCAILAGMTTAALVTGNTVVMKPASTAPVIAYKVFEILEGVRPNLIRLPTRLGHRNSHIGAFAPGLSGACPPALPVGTGPRSLIWLPSTDPVVAGGTP